MTTKLKTLGDRLFYLRTELAQPLISQTKMAKAIGMTRRIYQDFESYGRWPRADRLVMLIEYFRKHYPEWPIDGHWLLTGEGKAPGSDLVAILRDGVIVDVSVALRKLLGVPLEDIIGRGSGEFLTLDSKVKIDSLDGETESPYPAILLVNNHRDRRRFQVIPKTIVFGRKPARWLTLIESAEVAVANRAMTKVSAK